MKQIKDYINKGPINYGIALNGKWGSGKTYYIDNDIIPYIEENKLKSFYVSLNGVSSTQELKENILNKCLTKYVKGEESSIIDKASAIFTSLNALKPLSSNLNFSDFHFPDTTVVIFDDLERISSKYSYEELLGYINREFIEYKKFRVIIIGDFTKEKLKEDSFNKIKEKYIRWTISFTTELRPALLNLINNYKTRKKYYAHLSSKLEYIEKILNRSKEKNLRSIFYFLEVYEVIFEVLSDKKYVLIRDHILYSSLILCLEYREGSFESFEKPSNLPNIVNQYDLKRKVYNNYTSSFTDYEQKRIEEDSSFKNLVDRFERYKSTRFYDGLFRYKFIESIYKFIITGDLDTNKLKEELNEYSKIVKPIIKFKSNKYLDLVSMFSELSETELTLNINFLLQDLENGVVDLREYPKAINFLIFFYREKLYKVTKTKLISFIKSTLKDIKIDIRQNSKLQMIELFEFDEIKVFSLECHDLIQNKITVENNRRLELRTKDILDNWQNNATDFSLFSKIIEGTTAKDIYSKIESHASDRNFILNVVRSIKDNYKTINAGEFHSDDIPKLEKIGKLIKKNKWIKLDKIDKYYLKKLIMVIDKSIKHLIETRRKTA